MSVFGLLPTLTSTAIVADKVRFYRGNKVVFDVLAHVTGNCVVALALSILVPVGVLCLKTIKKFKKTHFEG